MSKNQGEPLQPTADVVKAAERELGTESGKRRTRKHEVRRDGSIAYFTELEEAAAEREVSEAEPTGIPARELGVPDGER